MRKRLPAARWIVAALVIFTSAQCIAGSCRATHAIEGDLLEITCNGQQSTVRLAGIDAPQMPAVKGRPGQPFCERARLHLAALVSTQTVSIETYGRDRYNRTIAVVFAGGINVNLEMVKAGLAEVYREESPQRLDLTVYRDAERKARRELLGIWVLRDQYFSPRDWREVYGPNLYD